MSFQKLLRCPLRPSIPVAFFALALAACGGGEKSGELDGGHDLDGDNGGRLCATQADCEPDEVCLAGTCRPEGWCEGDADCAEGQLCNRVNHVCVDAECLADEDCPGAEICVEGACQGRCEGVDCGPGMTCEEETGDCLRMTCTVGSNPCEADADCAEGLYCDPISAGCTECPTDFFCNFHECFALQLECQAHTDCASGERCNPDTNRCEGFPDSCAADKDCDPKYCNLYTHQCQDDPFTGACVADAECQTAYGPEYYCHPRLGNCVLPLDSGGCYDTADCGDENLVCNPKDNTCVERGTICSTDADCLAGDVCFNGTCVYQCDQPCAGDEECAPGESCRNGCCFETCYDDYDCAAGEECVNGWCQLITPCTDDGYEDNDDDASAASLPTPAAGVPDLYPGLAICTHDDDWFTVDVPGGSGIMVEIFFSHSQGDLDLYLYDDPSSSYLVRGFSSSDDEVVLWNDNPVDTTYYVRVVGFGSSENTYDMQITVDEAVDPCANDDAFEDNDSFTYASLLPLPALGTPDTYPDLAICDDEDWFKVEVPSGALMQVTIEFIDANGDLELAIYDDPVGSSLDSSTSASDNEQVSAQVGADTTLYIKVWGFSDANNSYLLRVEQLPSLCANDDAYEPNDTEGGALLLGLPDPGPDYYPDLVLCLDNEDWYAYELEAGDGLQGQVEFSDAVGDIELYLIDPNGGEIDSSTSATDVETVALGTAPTAGLYKLKVVHTGGDDDVIQDYAMRVWYFPGGVDPTCPDDALEPNDEAAAASPVGNSVVDRALCGADADWYQFALGAGERVEILAAVDAAAAAPVDLRLYAADETPLAEDLAVAPGTTGRVAASSDVATHVLLEARLVDPSPSDHALYDLLAVRMPADCADDGLEPNDEPALAAPITAGAYAGPVLCAGNPADVDWYSLDLQAGERVQVGVDFQPADGDLELDLYAADGQTLVAAGSVDGAHVSADSGRILAAGPLLIRIGAAGALVSNLPYRMVVDVLPPIQCADDGYEDNDAPDQPSALVEGQTSAVICNVDPDWFGLDLPSRYRLVVDATYDNFVAGLSLRLTDETGQTELASSATFGGLEQIDYVQLGDGPVRLEVSIAGAAEADRLPYDLDVTIEPPPPCTDDAAEPNNDAADATPIADPGSGPMVLCPGDGDWFSINASRGDILGFTLVNDGPVGDADLVLLDAELNELDRADAAGQADDAIVHEVWADGRFYARVEPKDPAALDEIGYHLDLAITNFSPCDDDWLEPNDSPEQATVVTDMDFQPVGGDYVLVLDPLEGCGTGPQDWFALDLRAGMHVSMSVAFPSGDFDIYLYDTDATTLIESSAVVDNPEIVDFEGGDVPADGRYYLRVNRYSDSFSEYSLTVTTDTPFICRSQPFDTFEPNATPAEADAQQHLAAGAFEATLCGAEDDWYALDATAGQTATVTVNFDPASDIDVYLYDADASTLLDASEGLGGTEVVSATLGQDGPVYVLLYFNKHNPALRAAYDLQVEVVDP